MCCRWLKYSSTISQLFRLYELNILMGIKSNDTQRDKRRQDLSWTFYLCSGPETLSAASWETVSFKANQMTQASASRSWVSSAVHDGMEPLAAPLWWWSVALVEGGGLVLHPPDHLLKLLLQLAHHGLDVGLHSLSDLSSQWLHLVPDGPVGVGEGSGPEWDQAEGKMFTRHKFLISMCDLKVGKKSDKLKYRDI